MTKQMGKVIRAGLLGLGLAMAVVPATTGCKAMKEGLENAMETSSDIEKEFGVGANVSININNGKQTIKVEFRETPEGDTKEIKAKVEKLVKKRFPDADEIDIKL